MKLYIVWNWHECYNAYTSKEKAIRAVKILRDRIIKDLDTSDPDDLILIEEFKQEPVILKGFNFSELRYYIFEVEEGETFGTETATDRKEQDVILD